MPDKGRERVTSVVPPCFAAPLQTRPCAGTSGERSNGRTRRRLNASPARLRDHVPLRAACPVPSFGLSVRRRRGVLFSSQPIYIITSNIRKIGGFVNIKPRNPGRRGSYSRAAPCCRRRPHEPGAWSSPLSASADAKVVSSIKSALEEGRPLMLTWTSTRPGSTGQTLEARFDAGLDVCLFGVGIFVLELPENDVLYHDKFLLLLAEILAALIVTSAQKLCKSFYLPYAAAGWYNKR